MVPRGHALLASLVLLASFMLLGCEDDSHALDFQIHFASPELADRAQRVQARILLGGCEGEEDLYESTFGADEEGALPEALGDGRYGFAARAMDESCHWYASGCRELQLPRGGDGSAIVMLEAMPVPALDCAAGCESRACPGGLDGGSGGSGGTGDAGPPRDAGMGDGQVSDGAAPDAVPPDDAGPPVMLEIEAEDGDPLRAPLAVIQAEMVSGGAYVAYPWKAEQTLEERNMLKRAMPPADDDADGIAVYAFEVTVSGAYRLWGRVNPPTLEEDSFWLRIDDGAWIQWNDISHETPWHWDHVRPFETRNERFLIPLEAGTHKLVLSYRELGCRIDKFLFTNDPDFVPSG